MDYGAKYGQNRVAQIITYAKGKCADVDRVVDLQHD
jgi:DNA polymerase III alpha subunit